MKLVYPAVFTYYEVDKCYTVEFPDLLGCTTGADTLQESIEMAIDAASGWLLTSIEDKEIIPSPSDIHSIKVKNANSFVNLIPVDLDEYSKKYGNKAIKKTLTIPQWLNTVAEHDGVNFSALLQKALLEYLHLTKQ
jgi:predicted RNase H-like HicB family nuclease